MENNKGKLNFAFFGGEPLAIYALDKLYASGLTPALIISNPDKPQGRNLEITPPPTALWAKKHNIPLIQPEKFNKEEFPKEIDFFVVVSYGKMIPKEILDLPKLGTLNIHPSLLPLYRGPSPIIAPILNGDQETGVTIIKINEKMDHGPILAQEKIKLSGSEFIEDLEKSLGKLGAELLIKIILDFISGNIRPKEQDHSQATFVKKITKADGEINLADDPNKNWAKFRAFYKSPRSFFFENGKRIIITKAKLEDGKFKIEKVIPEGGKETNYADQQ